MSLFPFCDDVGPRLSGEGRQAAGVDLSAVVGFRCSVYHGYCEITSVGQRKQSVISRLWLFSTVVRWMESSFPPGRLQNSFEWPFNSPDCCVRAMRKWSLTDYDSRAALNRRPNGETDSGSSSRQNGYVHST